MLEIERLKDTLSLFQDCILANAEIDSCEFLI